MAEVKILPQMTCKVLVVVFNRLTEVMGPSPLRITLLRSHSAHSSFNLNSTTEAWVKSSWPLPKQYAPNSLTSIAPNYINMGLFYSSTLKLPNKVLFI